MFEMIGYYYLHESGELIYKPPVVACSINDPYWDSPFVKKVWQINLAERKTAWILLLEALAMGCQIARAKELARNWGMNFDDSILMLANIPKEEVTPEMKAGIKIFIKEVLQMGEAEYWQKVREEGNGKVDERSDEGKT